MLSEFPILKTPRLVLRAICQSDAPLIHRNLSDFQTVMYSNASEAPSLKKVQQMIDKWKEDFNKQQSIRWGITIKEDIVIGSCGYKKIAKRYRRAEIGYEIFAEYRRQGLMSEALNAVIQFGFETMDFNRIEATVDPENLPSILLLNKLCFSEEGMLREYELQKERFSNLKLFSLLQRDFVGLSKYDLCQL
ncbi:MAG: GNAT family N-acetyltransferase [Cyanobacteria bacterium J06623_7]